MLSAPSRTSWRERIRAQPHLGHLFQRLVAYSLILSGLIYIFNSRNAAGYLGVVSQLPQGYREIKGYYGGGQIGLGLFILLVHQQDAFWLIFYTMSFLASARCFCTLPFALHMSDKQFEETSHKYVHMSIAFCIEFPCALLALMALQIWAPEYAQDELTRTRILTREIGKDLNKSRLTTVLRFLVTAHLAIVGLSFIFSPRYTASLYELYAPFALGVIEIQAMFGALRLGLAIYVSGTDGHNALILFACTYGFDAMAQTLDALGLLGAS